MIPPAMRIIRVSVVFAVGQATLMPPQSWRAISARYGATGQPRFGAGRLVGNGSVFHARDACRVAALRCA